MAKQQVQEFECDACDTTARITDFSSNHSLPDNWLHLVGTVDNAYAFELDLCPKHATKVLKAIKKEV